VERWKLHGQKWFCSLPMPTLRCCWRGPRGAAPGTRASHVRPAAATEDGSRTATDRAAEDKLGTRSMASGEIHPRRRHGLPRGRRDQGFKQMMEQAISRG